MSHHYDSNFENSTIDNTFIVDDKIVKQKEALAKDLKEFEAFIDKIAIGGSEDYMTAVAKCQKCIETLEIIIQP